MGINLCLSFTRGANGKNTPMQKKSISKGSRLIISKSAILSFKGSDMKKGIISSLEKDNSELRESNGLLKKQIDQLELSIKDIENIKCANREIELKLHSIISKSNEDQSALEQLNVVLSKEKDDLQKRVALLDKDKDEIDALTQMNDDMKMEFNLLEHKTKEEIDALRTVTYDLMKERDSLQRRIELYSTNSNDEITTLRSSMNILTKDKEDLKGHLLSGKNALNEIAALKSNNRVLTDDQKELKKINDSLRQSNKEKENEYNININQFKIDNDDLKLQIETLKDELVSNSNRDKQQYAQLSKANDELKIELDKEKNTHKEMGLMINDLNVRIKEYDRENRGYKSSLDENMILMQQLDQLQSKLNQIALIEHQTVPSMLSFKTLGIDKDKVSHEYIAMKPKSKTTKTETNPIQIQLQTHLKTISQLQLDKDALSKKINELNDGFSKKSNQLKDNKKIIKANISTIKDSIISTYEIQNLALSSFQKKFKDALLINNTKISKIQKALKTLTDTKANSVINANKEKALKDIINRLEVEKDKMNIKLTNYEHFFKELKAKVTLLESELNENMTKAQVLKKENEELIKSNKKQNQDIKDLQQKVDMYIIENSGKSKIIEERNDEIKQLKSQVKAKSN